MKESAILAVVLMSLRCQAQGGYGTGGSGHHGGSHGGSGGPEGPIGLAFDIQPPCLDYHQNCPIWAQSYCGYGSIFYDYMFKNCRKSCGFCNSHGSILAPGPIREDCSKVYCIAVVCGRDEIQIHNEGECCPKCVPRWKSWIRR